MGRILIVKFSKHPLCCRKTISVEYFKIQATYPRKKSWDTKQVFPFPTYSFFSIFVSVGRRYKNFSLHVF